MYSEALLNLARKTYVQCSTYRDSGFALVPDFKREMSKIVFQTYFKRPHHFRFDWIWDKDQKHRAVWCNKTRAYFQRDKGEIELVPSFAKGLSGATGTSFGCASLIANVLFPKGTLDRETILDISDGSIVAEESVLGIECHVLSSPSFSAHGTKLWLSSSDGSIRRVERDRYSLKTEREMIRAELETREGKLSAALNRQVRVDITNDDLPEQILVHDYNFETVLFDGSIDMTLFESAVE